MRSACLAAGLLIAFSLIHQSHAQHPPDKALSTFTVADGLKLELFASEPMFSNPTCMDVDEKGRVWVCESVNYRCHLHGKPLNRPEGDRIVILHDTDGDGKADKATTFYQAPDFLAPLGIAVSKDPVGPGYKVYVCHSPHIYVFEDKDGDGKADGPPKILLTGFGGIDHDHGVHGIHFGPDGKLYFSVGDQGVKNLKSNAPSGGRKPPEKSTSEKNMNEKTYTTNQTDCKAGTIWRCNTDGSGLELLAHNFRNQYEPAVNSFGTMFVSDNDDDGSQQTRICHVMYGGDYGYWPRNRGDHHWHEDQPGIVHKTLRTGFGSPTGMCWYEGKLLQSAFNRLLTPLYPQGRGAGGEGNSSRGAAQHDDPSKKPLTPNPSPREGEGNPYEGYLLHTDAGPREVRLFGVRPKGAGYELDKVNLVTSTDNWFRPSDICVAPDGSVFITDWYDPGVGGHGMGDTTRGRIYRLTAKEHQGYKIESFDHRTHKGFHQALASPNIATRQISAQQRGLDWVGFPIGNGSWYSEFEVHPSYMNNVFWAWSNSRHFVDVFPEMLAIELDAEESNPKDKREMGKPNSTELCKSHWPDLATLITPKNEVTFSKMIRREQSVARSREILLWLRTSSTELTKALFYDFAKQFDGQDRTYLSALNIACGTDPKRREVILAEFEKHFPDWNDKTAWLVWELQPPKVIAKLGKKLATEAMTPLQTELALGALAASTGVDGGESLLKLLDDTKVNRRVRAAALTTLLKYLPGKWSSLKSSFLVQKAIQVQMTDGEMLPAVVELVSICERKDFQGFLATLAYNSEGRSNQVRYAAIAGLGQMKNKEAVTTLTKILSRPDEAEARRLAMTTLGRMGYSEAMKPLQSFLLNDQTDADTRRLALEGLAGSRIGTTWLLEANAKRELPESMIAETGRLLRSSPYQDLRNKALIAFPFSKKMDVAKLPSPSMLAKKIGNAEHGKTLVHTNKDLGCVKCHGFQGIGGQIGPDLSMIGIKGSKENLFESILTPDKAIADQYIQHVIETKNGVVMSGLLVEETSDYLVLRDANGKDSKLALREVEKMTKSAKSLMPDNLASFITEEDLVDIVAYLTTMKSPALTIDRWQVVGPFSSDANDSGLDQKHGPEKGYNSSTSYSGKKGQIHWKPVSVNSTGYLDLAELHGDDAPMSVSYVYAEIDAPKEGWGEIKLGTDDGVNVLFNGRLVFRHRRHEAAQPGRDTISVEFQKGKNALMLQVSNGNNPHGVYCTVLPPGTEPAKLVMPK